VSTTLVVAAQCASPREPVFLPDLNSSGRGGGLFFHVFLIFSGWRSARPVAGTPGIRRLPSGRERNSVDSAGSTIAAGWAGFSATRIAHASLNRSPLSFDDIDRNYTPLSAEPENPWAR
jgi:hypothetical protein